MNLAERAAYTGKPIETLIDHIEFDEERDPVANRAFGKRSKHQILFQAS